MSSTGLSSTGWRRSVRRQQALRSQGLPQFDGHRALQVLDGLTDLIAVDRAEEHR